MLGSLGAALFTIVPTARTDRTDIDSLTSGTECKN